MLRIAFVLTLIAGITSPHAAAAPVDDALSVRARRFVANHETEVRPLEVAAAAAWWKANVTGSNADFKAKEQAQNRLDLALANPERFAELKSLKAASLGDPILARQIEVLHLSYLEKQLDPALLQQMTAKANAIEQAFNVYRANVNGREMNDSEVRKILKDSKDVVLRRAVWEAGKRVGPLVAADLKALVALRNEAARRLGFRDFHVLQLFLAEQTQEEVLVLFDELDRLTRAPFVQAKAEIDAKLAAQYGIAAAALRPWHYHDPFFQESPAVFDTDLDSAYAGVDLVKLSRDYYAGMGLPVDDVLARSDLFEKPGKSPHAFCTDIDREGDVRVLANVVPSEYRMGTLLHELGHAVYSSVNISRQVPYVLRTDAHAFCTEGVAMLFQRASKSADWLRAMGVTVANPAAFNRTGAHMYRNELLVFSRWCQVMFRFEKELYANPDHDLNRLWWDLVEKYQAIHRPEGRDAPDYASKIHVVVAPAYYHNYMLGQLFASQVHRTLAKEVLHTDPQQALFVGQPAVGQFMKDRVFAPARTKSWPRLTHDATGEPLNARAFAADFRN